MEQEQEQTTLPSRKQVHHRPKSDYSQWFRMILVIAFVCIVFGSIYWGYGKTNISIDKAGQQPGTDTQEPTDSQTQEGSSSEPAGESPGQGLDPIDLSDSSGEESGDEVSENSDGSAEDTDSAKDNNNDNSSSEDESIDVAFSGKTHIVQQGETLYSIAIRYFSDNSYVDKIARLNNLNDQKTIYAGFELKLPTQSP